jgi:DNA (cytosine-5)-methyltransferase 1
VTKLRVLDLFSGIGGFSLGLERSGNSSISFETVAFCEIEEFPRKVLAKHWPDVPQFEDVRKLRGEDVGPVDVICGGYPCQPFSQAGKRQGTADDRHLWPEFNRLVDELRPTWVIGENVAGHISMGLDDVLSDLEGQGYTCRPFVIPAVAVGAIHRRDRLWFVANSNRGRNSRLQHQLGEPCKARQRRAYYAPNSHNHASDTMRVRQSEPGRAEGSGNTTAKTNGEEHRTFDAIRRPTKSPIRRRDDGFSRGLDRDRLKALGNAVVPQIAEMIGRAILAASHNVSET